MMRNAEERHNCFRAFLIKAHATKPATLENAAAAQFLLPVSFVSYPLYGVYENKETHGHIYAYIRA